MSKKVPDWFNDDDFIMENVVIFKNDLVHFLTFQNEGIKSSSTIETKFKDKEGKPIIKTIPCVKYLVKEEKEEKNFNPISKQLINDLKDLFPLTNRTFRIELQKGRTDFENKYMIQEIKA